MNGRTSCSVLLVAVLLSSGLRMTAANGGPFMVSSSEVSVKEEDAGFSLGNYPRLP